MKKEKCDEFCERHQAAVKQIDERSKEGFKHIHSARNAVQRSFTPKKPRIFG